jgi:hypothetical protein
MTDPPDRAFERTAAPASLVRGSRLATLVGHLATRGSGRSPASRRSLKSTSGAPRGAPPSWGRCARVDEGVEGWRRDDRSSRRGSAALPAPPRGGVLDAARGPC